MQAIILAAGMGKRLKELTSYNTKCMVKVNGVTLIERMLSQLERLKLNKIVLVIGYQGEKLKNYVSTLNISTPIEYINNPIFDKTNNIYSLALAKNNLCEDNSLLFESDIIFEDSVLDALINDERETLALVDHYERWMDGTCIQIGQDDNIDSFVPKNKFKYEEKEEYYKTVNIYKFSKDFSINYYVPFLDAYSKALGNNEYYEQVLRVITMLDNPQIKAKRLNGQKWYEIDDVQDLDIASTLFAPDSKQRAALIHQRYGGYWRFPRMLDFCYLVNPFFPPQRLKDEIKASFDDLLTQYPSGIDVNSLLASKNFEITQSNIIVGNGAAELIKELLLKLEGTMGFIRPTFEEYPNRYIDGQSVYYYVNNADYTYTVDDIISYFGEIGINNLVLVNPDNPSGNYIEKKDILRLIQWTKEKSIKLIIDESFIDFSDEMGSIMCQDILDANHHLFVVKSISKSYGVPGIRLGILASSDTDMIAEIKKNVSIWNINSMGEFFLQILEKYSKEYQNALVDFRKERDRFFDELNQIPGLRVIPSQANYLMAELSGNISAEDLTSILLTKYDILIKNLAPKLSGKQYIRLAIRDSKDNDCLLAALKRELVL